jgi:D-mannonate dehydratase
VRHAGVDAVSIWTSIENNNAEWMIATRKKLEANGVQVYNIGVMDLHCDPALVLSLPGVETKIEQYKTYLANLGRAGIHYTTYAHMANIKNQPTPGFYQTSVGKTRGNANTREFDLEVARKLPCSFDKEYKEEQIWKSFTTFIRAVIPVAEKNKVRIGLHPDDPPVDSLGCVARVFRTYAAYERAFKTLEETLAENGPWILGARASLADINLMPYVARLDYLGLLGLWIDQRPRVQDWWALAREWPSFKTGLYELMTQAELEEMRTHGPTIRDDVAALLACVRTGAAPN